MRSLASTRRALCTGLDHSGVLAAARRPWLVIHPKPDAGDPAYDPLLHMMNFPVASPPVPPGAWQIRAVTF